MGRITLLLITAVLMMVAYRAFSMACQDLMEFLLVIGGMSSLALACITGLISIMTEEEPERRRRRRFWPL